MQTHGVRKLTRIDELIEGFCKPHVEALPEIL